MLTLYTDGSVRGNGSAKEASAHWMLELEDGLQTCDAELELPATYTHNAAELAAVGCALRSLKEYSKRLKVDTKHEDVTVKLDSQTVHYWLTGSKPGKVKDRQLVQAMVAKIAKLQENFKSCKYELIPRDDNLADPGYR
jgi:ribonuclease HI